MNDAADLLNEISTDDANGGAMFLLSCTLAEIWSRYRDTLSWREAREFYNAAQKLRLESTENDDSLPGRAGATLKSAENRGSEKQSPVFAKRQAAVLNQKAIAYSGPCYVRNGLLTATASGEEAANVTRMWRQDKINAGFYHYAELIPSGGPDYIINVRFNVRVMGSLWIGVRGEVLKDLHYSGHHDFNDNTPLCIPVTIDPQTVKNGVDIVFSLASGTACCSACFRQEELGADELLRCLDSIILEQDSAALTPGQIYLHLINSTANSGRQSARLTGRQAAIMSARQKNKKL